MSDTDSFIEEVTEEVRRDRLFRLMKKYGWIGILLVVLLVGGAAFNEWRKAREQAAAQALGDAIIKASSLEEAADRVRALAAISAEGDAAAVAALLAAAEALSADDPETALSLLEPVANDPSISDTYRHLAAFKAVLIAADSLEADDRIARLEPLAAAGAPYRLLAEEQMAVAEIDAGRTDAALERLRAILDDDEATAGLRRRATQLIVALGGDLTPS